METAEAINAIKIIGELILAFIVGMGGYKVQQKLASSTTKKQDTEGASEITSAAIELVKPLREEMQRLREELECQQKEINQLQRGVRILIAQLERLHIIPDWTPSDYISAKIENDNKHEQVRNIVTDKTPR